MKIPKLFPQKKLRATAARRSPLGVPDAADYEEMSEPNMKLSRALLIVLVLHVVAVAGIIAFNTIKTRQASAPPPFPKTAGSAAPIEPAKTETLAAASAAPSISPIPKAARSPAKPIAKAERVVRPGDKPAADSGKTYVVAKGDNPVNIAKKLKVPYDELIAVNHIEDPHKLQIGQKLIIPAKVAKARKSSD